MTTNYPIRQEVSDNRRLIRNQSNNFLEHLQFNSTDYARLHWMFDTQNLTEGGAVSTALLKNPKTAIDPALSGALTATLPMSIAVGDRNNERLEFIMLVNPANMTHGKTASISAAYTRKGFITQMWGPNQDLIISTGKTAAFMVDGSGLTNLGRRRSFAYANFLAFVFAYRNNGYLMLDPLTLSSTMTRVINTVHGVEIAYDNQVFTGHFNNFTIDEEADKPFLFEYNFEFVCSTLSGGEESTDEVRGHFAPIGKRPGVKEDPRLLDKITETNSVDKTIDRTVLLDNLNRPDFFEGELF